MTALIGRSVTRKEDPELVTGRGRFTADLHLPGMVHMTYVRSTEAHARLTNVDVSEARAMPGVLGVFVAADFACLPSLPHVPVPSPESPLLARPLLASERVRYVGEPIAVVVARDPYVAADAAQSVIASYEPLPVVASLEQALAGGTELLYPELGTNALPIIQLDAAARTRIDAALAASPRRVRFSVRNHRVAPAPIEPAVWLADWNASGLTLYMTTQAPHHVRNMLSATLGIPQQQCRVVAPHVGVDFGSKIEWFPEHWIVPTLSKRLGLPVRYVETRTDNLVNMFHGRDQLDHVEVGFDDEGHVLALAARIHQNLGAYADTIGFSLPVLTTWMLSGCYKIPAIAAEVVNVFTNQVPISSYRGAGRPEAMYLVERAIERVADELGLDAVEIRRRNFVQPAEFPYPSQANPEAVFYDAGNYPAAMDLACKMLDYDALRAERARRNADPAAKLMGIGFSAWVEIAGFGPRGSLEAFGHMGSWESVRLRVQPDGSVLISTGASPHGQGTVTVFAQIAAHELGVPFESVRVVHGDTETTPQGIGTMGSRQVAVGGGAVVEACRRVLPRATSIAAHLLGVEAQVLEHAGGRFQVKSEPARAVGWKEVAHASFSATALPAGIAVGALEELVHNEPPNFSYPSGVYACVVGIDRETGFVEIERFVAVDDCGVVINPMLADGQVAGGVAQGIAQAMFEEFRYDENAQPKTSTLVDYLVPAATEMPRFELGHVETPTPVNPLGAKGIGESGAVGAPPAVVNAVIDALADYGVRELDMPITPQKIWKIVRGGSPS